jgi:hypothetical protein
VTKEVTSAVSLRALKHLKNLNIASAVALKNNRIDLQ